MTKYQKLMEKSDFADRKATFFFHRKEWWLASFWKQASDGFKKKALEMSLEEGCAED